MREHQDRPRGGPGAPLSRDELEAKFRRNAALVLPAAGIEQVIRAVEGLAAGEPLGDLLAALSTAPSSPARRQP